MSEFKLHGCPAADSCWILHQTSESSHAHPKVSQLEGQENFLEKV
jgi:hypothetical protein